MIQLCMGIPYGVPADTGHLLVFGGDAHMPATRELAWVEEGTLTLTVAGEQHQVTAGQSARFPGGVPHAYRNDGSAPVSLTMIVVVPPALE